MDPQEQLAELRRGVVDLHSEAELLERLRSGKPLRVKAGFDPTRPDLHLGHTVLMAKMRQFQDLGHEVVFLIGDFTAQIGDPTGRTQTRPVPTRAEIEEGARTYTEQAFKILDAERTKVMWNGDWLGKMGFDDVIRLAGKYTLARMMERDDFKRRWHEQRSISLHELLYPLAQAYDSVVLQADVELGGTDQLFNLLVGREIMRESKQKPQVVMTTPILEGINARVEDGKVVGDKMSKSLDNYVGVSEAPKEQFGKLMSLADGVMWRYYELLSRVPMDEVARMKADAASGSMNPKEAKVRLAKEIVARFHGSADAERVHADWEAQFSRKEVPDDMPEKTLSVEGASAPLVNILVLSGALPSNSEGRRRIEQGAVSVDGDKVSDVHAALATGGTYVIKAGKRSWVRVTLARATA